MKKLFSLLTLLLLLAGCERGEHLTSVPGEKPISYRFTDQEKVCILIEEAIEVFTVDDFDIWFDSGLWTIMELTNPTQQQITTAQGMWEDGLEAMFTENGDLEQAFNSVVALGLTYSEFESLADNCDLQSFGCIFCSERACRNSWLVVTVGSSLNLEGWFFGYVGVLVHCD